MRQRILVAVTITFACAGDAATDPKPESAERQPIKPGAGRQRDLAAEPVGTAPAEPERNFEDPALRKKIVGNKAPPIDPLPTRGAKTTMIEAATPAAVGGRVALNVGFEALPGKLVPTLKPGCTLPCWSAAMVWPDGDATSVEFELFRGKSTSTRGATSLGRFRVDEVPSGEGRRSKVIVALGVVDGALHAHARHKMSGAALPLTKVR